MSRKLLRSPEDIRSVLAQKYKRHVTTWLARPELATYSLPLGVPMLHFARTNADKVQKWIDEWQEASETSPYWNVQLTTPTWRNVDFVSVPARVTIMGPDVIAEIVGKKDDWLLLRKRYNTLYSRFTAENNNSGLIIATAMRKCLNEVRSLSEEDFDYAIDIALWIVEHSKDSAQDSDLMVSHHSWIMDHVTFISVLIEALRTCRGIISGGRELGITSPPEGMRWIYFLDPSLRPAGIRSFMATINQLKNLQIHPRIILLCQSQYYLYALPDLPDTVAMHLGSTAIDDFIGIDWFKEATIVYWGSISTASFAILNQLRSSHQRVRTVLMDSTTLLKYEDKWECESDACLDNLEHLIPIERETYSFILQLGSSRYATLEVLANVKKVLHSWETIFSGTPKHTQVQEQRLRERLDYSDLIGEPHLEDNVCVCAVSLDQDKLPWNEALPALCQAINLISTKKGHPQV